MSNNLKMQHSNCDMLQTLPTISNVLRDNWRDHGKPLINFNSKLLKFKSSNFFSLGSGQMGQSKIFSKGKGVLPVIEDETADPKLKSPYLPMVNFIMSSEPRE